MSEKIFLCYSKHQQNLSQKYTSAFLQQKLSPSRLNFCGGKINGKKKHTKARK